MPTTAGSSLTEGPKIDDDIGGLSWVEATHYEPTMTDAGQTSNAHPLFRWYWMIPSRFQRMRNGKKKWTWKEKAK